MKVQEISRVTFNQFTEPEIITRKELGAQASSVLGYHVLKTAVSSELREALAKLEIAPLSTLDVEAYKKSKERKGLYSGTKACMVTTPVTAAVLGSIVWLAGLTHRLPGWSTAFMCGIFGIVVCVVLGFLGLILCTGLLTDEQMKGNRTVFRWDRYHVRQYKGAIPEFALRKAVQIQVACPNADLYIDHLMKDEERAPDPFLLATLGKETFYIDVWDEKEYESTL